MAHKHLVDLTETEQAYPLKLIHTGKPSARKVARAQVLLRAAEGAADGAIAQAPHLGVSTVRRARQRFVDEGLMPALRGRPRPGQRLALTGNQAAFSIALACSTPPMGRASVATSTKPAVRMPAFCGLSLNSSVNSSGR